MIVCRVLSSNLPINRIWFVGLILPSSVIGTMTAANRQTNKTEKQHIEHDQINKKPIIAYLRMALVRSISNDNRIGNGNKLAIFNVVSDCWLSHNLSTFSA